MVFTKETYVAAFRKHWDREQERWAAANTEKGQGHRPTFARWEEAAIEFWCIRKRWQVEGYEQMYGTLFNYNEQLQLKETVMSHSEKLNEQLDAYVEEQIRQALLLPKRKLGEAVNELEAARNEISGLELLVTEKEEIAEDIQRRLDEALATVREQEEIIVGFNGGKVLPVPALPSLE